MRPQAGSGWSAQRALWLGLALTIATSCDAQYIDLRPTSSQGALDTSNGGDVAADTGAEDVRRDPTSEVIDDGAQDPASASDGRPDGGGDTGVAEDRVLRVGAFEGRTGYSASGIVEIVAFASGGLELRLSDDFASQAVPGPVVVLTDRDSLGVALDEGADTVVSTLASDSGAQAYAIAEADEQTAREAAWVWIYCQPFGVEVARAELEAAP